jgi:ubiquitin C-terminal hydrolase
MNGETSTLTEKEPDDGIPQPKLVLFSNKVDMQWKAVRKIGAGLHNMGNTCFLNSTLQCLTYTAPLANYLMTDDHPQKCKYHSYFDMRKSIILLRVQLSL